MYLLLVRGQQQHGRSAGTWSMDGVPGERKSNVRVRRRPVCALAHKTACARDMGNCVLAMISIGVLIYFIHYVSVSIQAKFSSGHQRIKWPVWVFKSHSARKAPSRRPTGFKA